MHDLVGYCPLLWDWDDDKARINLRKHKIPFELAVRIFHDPLHNSIEDDYEFEERWKTIGQVQNHVLIVIHTIPMGDSPGRIISARKATRYERGQYEEQI